MMNHDHKMPDVQLQASMNVQFYNVDTGTSAGCVVWLDLSPGPVYNTFWLVVMHDSKVERRVLVKLPNYAEGASVQL